MEGCLGLHRQGSGPFALAMTCSQKADEREGVDAMTDSDPRRPAFPWRLFLVLLLVMATTPIAAACVSQDCPAGLHSYKDKCLTNMAIQYVGCTDGKGVNVTTEIGGGGTLKEVAEISLNLAYKEAKEENTPVALQIVKDCLEIARTTSPPDDPEQAAAAAFQREVIDSTPTITISPTTAREGSQVTVAGEKFWPTELIDIYLHAALIGQVQADDNGAFSTTINVPSSAPTPNFPTTITAAGRSSAKSAMASFETAP
jgi:hypothetical protein